MGNATELEESVRLTDETKRVCVKMMLLLSLEICFDVISNKFHQNSSTDSNC